MSNESNYDTATNFTAQRRAESRMQKVEKKTENKLSREIGKVKNNSKKNERGLIKTQALPKT